VGNIPFERGAYRNLMRPQRRFDAWANCGLPDREEMNRRIVLGLRVQLAQFTLLMVVNAFVGAMVGLERP